MIEEITQGLYRLEIPVPRNPLKVVNDYLIRTADRNLLIDTGMNLKECMDAMDRIIAELDLDMEQTDVFITHMHADHAGMIKHIIRSGSTLYCSKPDAVSLSQPYIWQTRFDYAKLNGFPTWDEAAFQNPDFNYFDIPMERFTLIGDGDMIIMPGWNLRCVFTPGHSKGHMCLYDVDRKWLFSGDHVLAGITPNIGLFIDDWNPLEDYLRSLDTIDALEVTLTLPGHRKSIKNLHKRVAELRAHHERRCDEIMRSLAGGPLDVFRIAGLIEWDLTYKKWEEFPNTQKWFAFGEVMAHLKYLEERGKVQRCVTEEGLITYHVSPNNRGQCINVGCR